MKHSPGFVKISEEAKEKVKEISVDEVYKRLSSGEKFHLVDVREDSEWVEGHAKGAKHIGKGVIERDIEITIPDKNSEIVLYCGGGYRSALAAEVLQRMGYHNVISMNGGIKAWREKHFPEEK
ncbi:MAG: sulfurtransferase [Deltaproteobacteria bacterium]|nr:sulfurtransferase [Deltaproteobacteria bacterium]